jgi:uncharacterized Tic20 family protein
MQNLLFPVDILMQIPGPTIFRVRQFTSMGLGFEAILTALRLDLGDWICDVSCKCRLFSGIVVSALLALVAILGPVIFWIMPPKDQNDTKSRTLFIAVYTVGTVGSLCATLIFACIREQIKHLKGNILHVIGLVLWFLFVVATYCVALVLPKWGDPWKCDADKKSSDAVCEMPNFQIARIVALAMSVLQLFALVLFNATLVKQAMKCLKRCLPCL